MNWEWWEKSSSCRDLLPVRHQITGCPIRRGFRRMGGTNHPSAEIHDYTRVHRLRRALQATWVLPVFRLTVELIEADFNLAD